MQKRGNTLSFGEMTLSQFLAAAHDLCAYCEWRGARSEDCSAESAPIKVLSAEAPALWVSGTALCLRFSDDCLRHSFRRSAALKGAFAWLKVDGCWAYLFGADDQHSRKVN